MLEWACPLAMADDQALWDQFLVQFRAEYADTQRGDKAREMIDMIKMRGIAIDQYYTYPTLRDSQKMPNMTLERQVPGNSFYEDYPKKWVSKSLKRTPKIGPPFDRQL